MLDVTVLLPVYNEEDKLRDNVLVLQKYLKSKKLLFEIIICDDGSTDKSLYIAHQIKEKINNVFVVGYPNNRGRGYALKHCDKYINGEKVVYFDTDFPSTIDLSLLDQMLKLLDDYHIVIASRFHEKGNGKEL